MKTIANNNITVRDTKINARDDAKIHIKAFKNEAKLSYKTSHGLLRMLTIKKSGLGNIYDLESFIAHFFRHYAIGVASEGTLQCISETLYRTISNHDSNTNIEAQIINSIRSFGLPMQSSLNRDEDLWIPSEQDKFSKIQRATYH